MTGEIISTQMPGDVASDTTKDGSDPMLCFGRASSDCSVKSIVEGYQRSTERDAAVAIVETLRGETQRTTLFGAVAKLVAGPSV